MKSFRAVYTDRSSATASYAGSGTMDGCLSDTCLWAVAITSWLHSARVHIMNTSHNASNASPVYMDSDPDFGLYEVRIFWLAATAAVVAVLAVAYFKMGY